MRAKGFTLTELLVVMALMALAASLVGPASVRLVEKTQAQAEFKQLQQRIRRLSYVAYQRSQPWVLETNGALMTAAPEGGEPVGGQTQEGDIASEQRATLIEALWPEQPPFSHLQLGQQQLRFNRNGYPTPETLNVELRGESIKLNVFRLVEATE